MDLSLGRGNRIDGYGQTEMGCSNSDREGRGDKRINMRRDN